MSREIRIDTGVDRTLLSPRILASYSFNFIFHLQMFVVVPKVYLSISASKGKADTWNLRNFAPVPRSYFSRLVLSFFFRPAPFLFSLSLSQELRINTAGVSTTLRKDFGGGGTTRASGTQGVSGYLCDSSCSVPTPGLVGWLARAVSNSKPRRCFFGARREISRAKAGKKIPRGAHPRKISFR